MLRVCEEHYKAVVTYMGLDCPLCEAEKTIDELTTELERTQDELDRTHVTLAEMREGEWRA
jgi:uncharacterized coiled-coil protein SlyX